MRELLLNVSYVWCVNELTLGKSINPLFALAFMGAGNRNKLEQKFNFYNFISKLCMGASVKFKEIFH